MYYDFIEYFSGGVKILGKSRFRMLGQLYVRGEGNIVEIYGSVSDSVKIYMLGNNCHVVVETGANVNGGVLWLEDDGCCLHICGGTTIEDAHLAVAENGSMLVIGKDCMLSSKIRISTTDSHSVIDLNTNKRINPAGDIIIGDHVWVGYHVAINKGCRIGNGAVLAGNSVITKDVPSNVVAAGVPAKVVKRNVTWNRKRM